jgi:hypothetical protein
VKWTGRDATVGIEVTARHEDEYKSRRATRHCLSTKPTTPEKHGGEAAREATGDSCPSSTRTTSICPNGSPR